MKNNKSIAILGGMGPQASAKLLQVIVDMAARDFLAKNDDDFPEVIVSSVPVPDFISNKKNLPIVLSMLKQRVRSLEAFNPVSFSIACNTAHILLGDLQRVTKIPFISIIDEVVNEIADAKITKVGLLGTPVTLQSRLYQDALQIQNIKTITPSKGNQKIVAMIIRKVLAGSANENDVKKLVKIAESLKNKGAQGIILGCTELPLIFPKDFELKVFDSIEILARALLRNYFHLKTIN